MSILQQDRKDEEQAQGMNNPQQQPQMNAQTNTGEQQLSSTASSAPSASTQPTAGLNTPPVPGTTAPTASNSNQVNPKAGSGAFTNIRQYIKANEGNRVASAAGQQMQKTGEQAQKNITTGVDEFGRRVESGSLQNRGTAVRDVKNVVSGAQQIDVTNRPVVQQAPAQQPTNPRTSSPPPQKQKVGIVRPLPEVQPGPRTSGPAVQQNQPIVKDTAQTGTKSATDLYGNLLQGLDTQRFSDVINAQYQGPQSLRQAGLLDPISKRVDQAQRQLDLSQTASGREDLLREMFGQNRQYTQGQNRLDALLLNTSEGGVQNLLDRAGDVGNLRQQMDKAQLQSGNLAQSMTKEIDKIRGQARTHFTGAKSAYDSNLEKVLEKAQGQGDQYFDLMQKELLGGQNMAPTRVNVDGKWVTQDPQTNQPVFMNELGRSMLGVGENERLFNIKDLPKTELERAKLVTKNEQARQEALARLAELDKSNKLDKNIKYSNALDAGTQKVTDSVNTEQLRKDLNMSKSEFDKWAKKTDLTGTGTDYERYSRGLGKARGKAYASAEIEKNVGDWLKQGGYDFDAKTVQALATDPAIRQAMGLPVTAEELSKTSVGKATAGKEQQNLIQNAIGSTAGGQALGDVMKGDLGGAVASALGGPLFNADQREAIGNLSRQVGGDMYGDYADNLLGSVDFAADGVDQLTSSIGLGNVGSNIFGGGKGAAQKKAQASANRLAVEDLKKQFLESLSQKGFDRSAQVLDTKGLQGSIGNLGEQQKNIQSQLTQAAADEKRFRELLSNVSNISNQQYIAGQYRNTTQAVERDDYSQYADDQIAELNKQIEADTKAASRQSYGANNWGSAAAQARLAENQQKVQQLQELKKLTETYGSGLNFKDYTSQQNKALQDLQNQQGQSTALLRQSKAADQRQRDIEAFMKTIDRRNF